MANLRKSLSEIVSREDIKLIYWFSQTYVRPYRLRMIAAAACLFASSTTLAGLIYLIGPALNNVTSPTGDIYLIPLGVLALVTINGGVLYLQGLLNESTSARVTEALETDLFQRYIHADLAWLDRQHSSAVVAIMTGHTGALVSGLSGIVIMLARDISLCVFLVVIMVWRDWQLALIAFVSVPLLGVGVRKVNGGLRRTMTAVMTAQGQMTQILVDSVTGSRVIKLNGAEPQEQARFRDATRERESHSVRMSRLRSATTPINEFAGGLAMALAIFYASYRTRGDVSLGDLGSFVAALGAAFRPLKRVAATLATIQSSIVAARAIKDALDTRPTIVDPPDATSLAVTAGAVSYESVSFAYVVKQPVIAGLTLHVPAGRTIALVGQSGGGKTTLLSLLARLYDVDGGRIMIDGTDIRDVTMASLRAAIGVVTQDTMLFDDSVLANIAYGCAGASEEAVIAAAKAADAHAFITGLPRGYHTRVGQRGVLLSGGQRQRIAIARAILRDAPILLLDEPTSALDVASERAVKDALRRLMRGRTTIIVAHRLSTVVDADCIHVIERGAIVESGTHAELLRRGEAYARLYNAQAVAEAA